jgi:hypothetical protein
MLWVERANRNGGQSRGAQERARQMGWGLRVGHININGLGLKTMDRSSVADALSTIDADVVSVVETHWKAGKCWVPGYKLVSTDPGGSEGPKWQRCRHLGAKRHG